MGDGAGVGASAGVGVGVGDADSGDATAWGGSDAGTSGSPPQATSKTAASAAAHIASAPRRAKAQASLKSDVID